VITIIQVVLIIAIVAAMVWLLARRDARARAIWILLGGAFTVFAIITVLFPNITGVVAHWVGVGRGTDLLLYLLVLVVLVSLVHQVLQHQQDQRRIAAIARELALLRAALDPDPPEDTPK